MEKEVTPSEVFPDIGPMNDGATGELFDIDEEAEIQPKRLGFWKTCLKYFRLLLQMLFSYVGLTAILVGYLLLGAVVFGAIERPVERRIRDEIKRKKTQFFMDLYNKSDSLPLENWTQIALIQLSKIERIPKAHYYIFDDVDGTTTEKWSFFGSMLFSLTVVSTIGYGHIAPVTPVGQVFCIVYALVGLPLMLLVLTNVGRVMANVARILYIVYTSRLCRRLRKQCKKKKKPKKRRKKKLKKRSKRKARLKENERMKRPRGNPPKKERKNSKIKKTPSQATIRVDAGPYREGRPMSVNMELMKQEPPFPPSYSESKDLGTKLNDSLSDKVSNKDRLSDRVPSDKFSSDKASSEKISSEKISSEVSFEKEPEKSPSEKDTTSVKEVEGIIQDDPKNEKAHDPNPVPTTPDMYRAPRAVDDEDYDIGEYISDDDDDEDDDEEEFLMANDDIPPDYAPPPPPPGEAPFEQSDVELLDISRDQDANDTTDREEPETAQVTATSESDRDTDADVTTPLVRHASLKETSSSRRPRKPILRTGSSLEFGEYHRQRLQKRQKSCIDFRQFDEQSMAASELKEVVINEEPDVYRITIPEEDTTTMRSEMDYSFSESANESGGRRRIYRKGKGPKPRKRRVTKEERRAAADAIKERKQNAKENAKMAAKERAYMLRQRKIDERHRKSTSKRKGATLCVRRPIMAPPTLRALHNGRQLQHRESATAVRLSTYNKNLGNSREDITSSVKGLRTEKLNLVCEYDNGKVRVSPTLRRGLSTRSRYSTKSKYSERSKFSEYSNRSGYSVSDRSRSGYSVSDRSKTSSISSSRSGSRRGRRKKRKGKGSISDSSAPSCSEGGRDSDMESSDEEEQQRELTTADIPIGPVLAFFFGYIGAGAILFKILEGDEWSLFESFYFCFITLTTIGFGDFVPDNSMESLIACCLYTMIGMAVTSMCIALMMKKFVATIQNIGKKVGIIEDTDGPS